MFPAAAFTGKHVAGEIKFMQALHDNDLDAGGGIIDAAAKRGIKTQVDGFPFHLADGLLRVERIVKDQYVATHAGSGGLHAGGEHGAANGILIVAFDVLIMRQREDPAPLFLVPRRLNDAATKNAVVRAELLRVRNEHKPAGWPGGPNP